MSRFPSSRAVHGLLGAALALCSNLPEARAAFSQLPDPIIEDLVDEVERTDVATHSRQRLLSSLAQDSRAAVRARVAEAAGRLWQEDVVFGSTLLARLAQDPTTSVGAAAARGLARLLAGTRDPLRASIESSWIAAHSAQQRFTLAVAVGLAPPHFLTDLVLQELADDADAAVRWAALRAAEALLDADPPGYTRLALCHVADANRDVREAARGVLRQAARRGWAVADRPKPHTQRAARQRFRHALRSSSPELRVSRRAS